jgi:hypothetical protein
MDQPAAAAPNMPAPIEGKTVFQISPDVRIRFNADGWVEEMGRGGPEEPLGTHLQGRAGSALDDRFARRYYDLYTRAIVIDIFARREADRSAGRGLVLFKDLEPDSPMYRRVNKIIEIGNHYFKMSLKPLA